MKADAAIWEDIKKQEAIMWKRELTVKNDELAKTTKRMRMLERELEK